MGYAVAKVLLNGSIALNDFRGDALSDPATHALAARVATIDDGNPDPNALAPQRVAIRLRDGRIVEWQCDTMLANPARPLSDARHLAKFEDCLRYATEPLAPDTGARLAAAVAELERLDDVRTLAALASSRS
jgi:2-methylcitrate dehydratase PrpD